jgi:hypothetical protein
MGARTRRISTRGTLLVILGVALLTGLASTALADDDPQPVDVAHNVTGAPAPVAGAVFGSGPAVKTGSAICSTPTQTGANVNTDCENRGDQRDLDRGQSHRYPEHPGR